MRPALLIVCGLLLGAAPRAGGPDRAIPEHCGEHAPTTDERDAPALWNASYRRGFRAIEAGDYVHAESEMCRALWAAREFDARDWRFAETLDELGLIAYQLRDYELAERLQGAAIAEMLLAVGPAGEPLGEIDPSHPFIRPDCSSGVRVYTERLGWIHEHVPARIGTDELRGAPWLVFSAGYLPLDARLARRLDWLVSRYLLEENLVAADALSELQREIADGTRSPVSSP